MPPTLTLLFLGDIVGRPGRDVVTKHLPALVAKHSIDFVVANAENIAGGTGVTADTLQQIYAAGVHAVTLGNHTWAKADVDTILTTDRKVLRPYNYPKGTIGEGFRVFTAATGKKVAVLNLMGRVYMENGLDCPFQASRSLMANHQLGTDYDALLVDIHAEASSEKVCLAHIWDGKASLVVGTHTHIPTADARIQPKGTAYQTDAGMCGDYESSIGVKFSSAVPRFERRGRMPQWQVADGEATLCGTLVQVGEDGLATGIHPIRLGGVLQAAG